MLSRRVCLSFALLTAFSVCGLASDKSPFEGKWQLDKKKTKAVGAPEDLQEEISIDGSKMVIKSKYQEPRNAIYPLMWVGIMTYELPLTLDGESKLNQIGPFMHNSRTTVEGNKMTTDFTANMEGGTVTGQWIRTLSDDGKEMNLEVITKSTDGRKMDQTLVLKRR